MMIKILLISLLIGFAYGRIVLEEEDTIRARAKVSFPGCKIDPFIPRSKKNVFFKCQNASQAHAAALKISSPGSTKAECDGSHRYELGYYAHFHPADHALHNGKNYHFHWGVTTNWCTQSGWI